MTRLLGAAANGAALRLRAIEVFGQDILRATTHMRVVFWVAPNGIHHGVVTLSNEKRDGTTFRVSSGCWSASRQVFNGVARNARCVWGRCEVALDVEGVGAALIGFPIGATMALSAGMIVLFVFAAIGAVLVLWAGERSDSDPDLGAGLDTFPSRCGCS